MNLYSFSSTKEFLDHIFDLNSHVYMIENQIPKKIDHNVLANNVQIG